MFRDGLQFRRCADMRNRARQAPLHLLLEPVVGLGAVFVLEVGMVLADGEVGVGPGHVLAASQ
jgi:hypothetical protein